MKGKKKLIILCLLTLIMLLAVSYIGSKICGAYKLSKFQDKVAAVEPSQRTFRTFTDGTIAFTSPSASLAVLSEETNPASLYKAVLNNKRLHVLIMPEDTLEMRERVFLALRSGLTIACLLTPSNTDTVFFEEVTALCEFCKCVPVKKDSYQLFGDCAIYFQGSTKDTLSFSWEHGSNSFFYSSEPINFLLSNKEVDVAIMPYDALVSSDILCEYAIFDNTEVDETILSEKAFQYRNDLASISLYCSSDGDSLDFDISFTSAGRLQGQN